MELKFVSPELAKKLKEIGFNEKCKKLYNLHGELWDCHYAYVTNADMDSEGNSAAPKLEEAWKWFRDELNIDLWMSPVGVGGSFYHIENITVGDKRIGGINFLSKTFEHALEMGLLEACQYLHDRKTRVSLEYAKKLKKLGFDGPCEKYYDISVGNGTMLFDGDIDKDGFKHDSYVKAPTILEADNWIKEKKINLKIYVK